MSGEPEEKLPNQNRESSFQACDPEQEAGPHCDKSSQLHRNSSQKTEDESADQESDTEEGILLEEPGDSDCDPPVLSLSPCDKTERVRYSPICAAQAGDEDLYQEEAEEREEEDNLVEAGVGDQGGGDRWCLGTGTGGHTEDREEWGEEEEEDAGCGLEEALGLYDEIVEEEASREEEELLAELAREEELLARLTEKEARRGQEEQLGAQGEDEENRVFPTTHC